MNNNTSSTIALNNNINTNTKTLVPLENYGIDYKPTYMLSQASAGQIMLALSKLGINKKYKNPYELYLSEWFSNNVPSLVNEFEKMLSYSNGIEFSIKYKNLLLNLPPNTFINGKYHNVELKYANVKNLLSALNNRINKILEKNVPTYYTTNKELLNNYEKMRDDLETLKYVLYDFKNDFDNAVKIAKNIETYKQTI